MICNEKFEDNIISEVNFLWNDELYRGFPICLSCTEIEELQTKYLNYGSYWEKERRDKPEEKPRGRMDKWLGTSR